MNRTFLLRIVFLLVTSACIDTPDSRPNIVIILADDMGYGDVGALNAESKIPTPNIDRLATEGMTFTDGHSPSAVCTPTRYGLLTGRYAWRTRLQKGVLGGYSPPLLELNRPTIASMLQESGYRTGAIGKWHLGMELPLQEDGAVNLEVWAGDPGIDFAGQIGDSPIHHGFDYFFGISASLDMAPYVYIRNDRFTMVPEIDQEAVDFPHFVRSGPRSADFVIGGVLDRLTQEAVEFVRQSATTSQPFFLYLPLTGPHKPTQPHERFRGKTGLNEYGDFVYQVDWTVGQVLQAIDKEGIGSSTFVLYTSDNGSYMYSYEASAEADHVNDPTRDGYLPRHHRANGLLRGTKADIWEAGHRVPLFVRWPGQITAQSKSTATVCLVDLFATCAELAGLNIPDGAAEDSYSLVPALRGEDFDRGVPIIHHSANGTFALRHKEWKLILGSGSGGREAPVGRPFEEPYKLFNLSRDLGEHHDVAAHHPELAKQLTARFEAIRTTASK
jgi:arylsulfatase A-like enzyme